MARMDEQVLLYGEWRIVAESAALLQQRGITLTIVHDAEQLPSLEYAHLPHGTPETILHHVSSANPTLLLDLSYSPTNRASRIHLAHALAGTFSNLLILASTLTCTATELHRQMPPGVDVIGFDAMPGWTSFAQIEIAPSLRVSPNAVERAQQFFKQLGFGIEVVEDRVGLVIPRILALLINEAAFAVMEKIAQPGDIDEAVKLGMNYPHGLLEWADMIGLDCILSILDALYDEYREPRYRACVLLRQYVRAGMLGKATGKGFFSYTTAA